MRSGLGCVAMRPLSSLRSCSYAVGSELLPAARGPAVEPVQVHGRVAHAMLAARPGRLGCVRSGRAVGLGFLSAHDPFQRPRDLPNPDTARPSAGGVGELACVQRWCQEASRKRERGGVSDAVAEGFAQDEPLRGDLVKRRLARCTAGSAGHMHGWHVGDIHGAHKAAMMPGTSLSRSTY